MSDIDLNALTDKQIDDMVSMYNSGDLYLTECKDGHEHYPRVITNRMIFLKNKDGVVRAFHTPQSLEIAEKVFDVLSRPGPPYRLS